MTIDTNGPGCECGNIGCLEQLAAGKAIAREAKKRLGSGERSTLTEEVAGKLENVTAEDVAVVAKKGDTLAVDVLTSAATYLGVGMVNLVNIFNPEMIIVGGGMSKMGELLLNPARQVVRERAFPLCAEVVRIVAAQLGDDPHATTETPRTWSRACSASSYGLRGALAFEHRRPRKCAADLWPITGARRAVPPQVWHTRTIRDRMGPSTFGMGASMAPSQQ